MSVLFYSLLVFVIGSNCAHTKCRHTCECISISLYVYMHLGSDLQEMSELVPLSFKDFILISHHSLSLFVSMFLCFPFIF